MPLSNFDSYSSESLLIRCLECRVWDYWSKPALKFLEFNYDFIDRVEDRAFSMVYRCNERLTGRKVAIKEIAISDKCEAVPGSMIREISYFKELHHVNIVRLLDLLNRGNYLYLVFEYLDLDLLYYIRQPNFTKAPLLTKNYLYQILSAVAYYHSLGIIHRDLKPENLLLDFVNNIVKVADFNLTRAFGDQEKCYMIATPWYSAPELLLGFRQYSTAVDVWSVGCIFGEMVTGEAVFRCKSPKDQLKAIFCVLGTPTEETWPGVSELCSSFSSNKFESMDLARKFPGLEPDGCDLLSKMLCLNPNQRISAEGALSHPYFKDLK